MDLMTYALCKGNGGGGSSNKFIVTLTPTAQDYSGTMDKTVAEINAAYEAGQKIVFSLSAGGYTYEIPLAYRSVGSDDNLYFACYIINIGANMIIIAYTSDVQESSTYSAAVYTLTPVS